MNVQTAVVSRKYPVILLQWESGFTVHLSSKAVNAYLQGIRTRETTGEKSELGDLDKTSTVMIQSGLYKQVKKEGGSSFFASILDLNIQSSER